MKYKGVVIGCGNIGALWEADAMRAKPGSHAGTLASNPKTQLSALVDINPDNLSKAGALFPKAARYTDLRKCLTKEKPDIAIVATNLPSHADVIETCAQAGIKMIIGEKPLADSLENAVRIRRVIKENDVTFVLNYQRRLFPLFHRVKERITQGGVGRIQQVTCFYSNGLYNNGGHSIDAITYLLGLKIQNVSGFLNERNTTHPAGDSNIDAILRTEDGTTITLQSFDQKAFPIHEFCIFGERGLFILHEFGYAFENVPLKNSPLTGFLEPAYAESKRTEDKRSMTADVLDELIAAHEEKRPVGTGIINGIETLTVLEAISESANHGGVPAKVRYTENI